MTRQFAPQRSFADDAELSAWYVERLRPKLAQAIRERGHVRPQGGFEPALRMFVVEFVAGRARRS